MDLNSKNILSVLKNLIGGDISDTPLGKGIVVSNREAFLFSAITGAVYFENHIFPFTPKGLLKIFYNALNYNFVTGIFDNYIIKNTPHYLSQHREYLSNSNKTIVPLEIESEKELRSILSSKYPNGESDSNILILRVDLSKKGYGLESLMEYFACKFFSDKGYITENQIPLSHTLGSPDFGGFGILEIQKNISRLELLPFGFNIIELSMLRTFPIDSKVNTQKIIKNELIVGEAKTSTTTMNDQLEKYMTSAYFDMGIEIQPAKVKSSNPKFGLLSIKEGEVYFDNPQISKKYSNDNVQNTYKNWLEIYFNCYLISNYSNDELSEIAKSKFNINLESKKDLLKLVTDVKFETHLLTLKEFLKNGTF